VYYTPVEKTCDRELENKIIEIFKSSRKNYSASKIKVELNKVGLNVSRRYLYSLVMALVIWGLAGVSVYLASLKGMINPAEVFTCIVSGALVMVMTMIQFPL
jgi:uncharacterized membrane protein